MILLFIFNSFLVFCYILLDLLSSILIIFYFNPLYLYIYSHHLFIIMINLIILCVSYTLSTIFSHLVFYKGAKHLKMRVIQIIQQFRNQTYYTSESLNLQYIYTLELLTNLQQQKFNIKMNEQKINDIFPAVKKTQVSAPNYCMSQKKDSKSILDKTIHCQEGSTMQNNDDMNQDTKIQTKSIVRNSQALDDMQTISVPVKYKKLSQINVIDPLKPAVDTMMIDQIKNDEIIPQIPKNNSRKVEQILKKAPLRNRFTGLLPRYLAFPIGYKNKMLIQKMVYMDRVIIFYSQNRDNKLPFFQDIRKTILETMRSSVTLGDLKQIMYLNHKAYKLSWQKNENLKKYDLLVRLVPLRGQTQDERKIQLRKNLFEYLDKMHEQFLIINKLDDPMNENQWHIDFNIQNIDIPDGQFPPHPTQKRVQIKDMSQKQLNSIQNKQIKTIFKKEIESQNQQLSLKSASALILNKKRSKNEFTNQLYQMIKKKQQKLAEARQKQSGDSKSVRNQIQFVSKFCQQLLAFYIMKGYSNIFYVNVVEAMHKRLNQDVSLQQIKTYIDKILKSDIKFLTEVKLPNKGVILKMEKDKYQEIQAYFNNVQAMSQN